MDLIKYHTMVVKYIGKEMKSFKSLYAWVFLLFVTFAIFSGFYFLIAWFTNIGLSFYLYLLCFAFFLGGIERIILGISGLKDGYISDWLFYLFFDPFFGHRNNGDTGKGAYILSIVCLLFGAVNLAISYAFLLALI